MKTKVISLHIRKNRNLGDVQQEFSKAYPFLKLEFYKPRAGDSGLSERQKLNRSLALNSLTALQEGEIELNDTMTVAQLENILCGTFGICAQVSRKSGNLWLETTISDNWTLKQQNDHGKELSSS